LFLYDFTETETNTKSTKTNTKPDTARNKYRPNMDEKWMITGNKVLLESCRKTQATQVNMTNQTYHNF
jgi:hypothetical protein